MSATQDNLIKCKCQLLSLKNQKDICKQEIEKLGHWLVRSLKTIPGWECMILSCKHHYDKCPEQFFDWCKYEFEDEANALYVKKYYTNDPDAYVVLKLDLEMPLDEQVKNRMAELENFKREKLMRQYNKDMDTFRSLGMHPIDFEEWLKKKNKIDNAEDDD